MEAAGIEVSAFGIAKMYSDVCSHIVIAPKDKSLEKKIEALNVWVN